MVAMNIKSIPVIDVFAGPGGLNEGFSRVGKGLSTSFRTALSIEMDPVACRTLRLRSVRRTLQRTPQYFDYLEYAAGNLPLKSFLAIPNVSAAFAVAEREVLELELGPESRSTSRRAIQQALSASSTDDWVLIGGPPCQAYSLAGRSRRANDVTFANDKKHFLYREYLAILRDFAPPVFVMENVKGLLSSRHSENSIFDLILSDLKLPRPALEYEILSMAVTREGHLNPSDFVLRAEKYGVPQKRHRVILVGVRRDVAERGFRLQPLAEQARVTVQEAIYDLPRLRSGISPASRDSADDWERIRGAAAERAGVEQSVDHLTRGARFFERTAPVSADSLYERWVMVPGMNGVLQHESRSHMVADLERYFYVAAWATKHGVSPRLRELPKDLLPLHKNAESEGRPFDDRFRVQLATEPSTTVVSHISKDGHYYIHPDPQQMRSLTVREAARLQTFPDDYFFEGNRTQQYHQVGNAVPPLLAYQVGTAIARAFERTSSRPEDRRRA